MTPSVYPFSVRCAEMIRLLFAIALGGAISLIILSLTGSPRFITWGVGFVAASMVLFFSRIMVGIVLRSRRVRHEINEAKKYGRVRAALILDRSQTGLYMNEQPQIDFTLLVDRPGKKPLYRIRP